MHLIVYVSHCAVPAEQTEAALQEIIGFAQPKNREDGITGVLFCENGHFIQVMEGEESNLRRTFERIERDPRHRDISILVDQPVAARSFQEWSLDTFFVDTPHLVTPETLRDLRDLYTRNLEMDAAQMVAFLKALIDEMDKFIILSRSKDAGDHPS
jgi:hypothetical protein